MVFLSKVLFTSFQKKKNFLTKTSRLSILENEFLVSVAEFVPRAMLVRIDVNKSNRNINIKNRNIKAIRKMHKKFFVFNKTKTTK